jgi:hypothetical protein
MVRPPDKPTAKSGKPTSEMGNPDPRLSALDVLREFVTDIEDVYGTNGALDLIREWEDLHITYQHAKEVLAKADITIATGVALSTET